MASRTHRIPACLAWGCALLLGAGLSGCATATDTGVSDPTGQVHFTVPDDWQPIGASALAAELKTTIGNPSASWTVAYEAGSRQRAADSPTPGTWTP